MADYHGIRTFIERIFYREPAIPYFYAYLETQMLRMQDTRAIAATLGATFTAVVGLGAAFFALALAKTWHLPMLLLGLTAAGIAGFATWYSGGKKRERNELTDLETSARPLLKQLYDFKVQRKLDRYLAGGVGELLNQGAKYWIECRQSLDSAVWLGAGSDSVWISTRQKALLAMDSAMLRLVLATQHNRVAGADFLSPTLDPAIGLVEEMREMARTARRMTDKLIHHGGIESGSATEIQDALLEMRRLEQAQDEVQRISQGDL
jgi:hypothetical protein